MRCLIFEDRIDFSNNDVVITDLMEINTIILTDIARGFCINIRAKKNR